MSWDIESVQIKDVLIYSTYYA